jgi:DNA-binding MarR family transcriptional regulator
MRKQMAAEGMMDDGFTPLERDAWGGLVVAHGTLRRRLDAALQERHRLSHAEFEVLLLLAQPPEQRLRLSDLAARSMLTLSGMSRLVDRLAAAGLVARAAAEEDRRGTYVQLTPAGRERFRAARATDVTVVREHFLSLYREEELAQLARFWRRFIEHERAGDCEAADAQARRRHAPLAGVAAH